MTRNTRGLTRSVIALIVPPLPAPSRPSKTMQTLAPFALTHSCSLTSSTWSFFSSFSYFFVESFSSSLLLPLSTFRFAFFPSSAIRSSLPEILVLLVLLRLFGVLARVARRCIRIEDLHVRCRRGATDHVRDFARPVEGDPVRVQMVVPVGPFPVLEGGGAIRRRIAERDQHLLPRHAALDPAVFDRPTHRLRVGRDARLGIALHQRLGQV